MAMYQVLSSNLVSEIVLRESAIITNGCIYSCRHLCIGYLDNMALKARSKTKLKRVVGFTTH